MQGYDNGKFGMHRQGLNDCSRLLRQGVAVAPYEDAPSPETIHPRLRRPDTLAFSDEPMPYSAMQRNHLVLMAFCFKQKPPMSLLHQWTVKFIPL